MSLMQVPAAYAPELVDSLLLHIEPSLSSLAPSQLAQMVWALKQLQHTPTEVWLLHTMAIYPIAVGF